MSSKNLSEFILQKNIVFSKYSCIQFCIRRFLDKIFLLISPFPLAASTRIEQIELADSLLFCHPTAHSIRV